MLTFIKEGVSVGGWRHPPTSNTTTPLLPVWLLLRPSVLLPLLLIISFRKIEPLWHCGWAWVATAACYKVQFLIIARLRRHHQLLFKNVDLKAFFDSVGVHVKNPVKSILSLPPFEDPALNNMNYSSNSDFDIVCKKNNVNPTLESSSIKQQVFNKINSRVTSTQESCCPWHLGGETLSAVSPCPAGDGAKSFFFQYF